MSQNTRKKLKEGEDCYFDEQGLLVLTKEFLIRRGFCCHNNCTNCPYKNTDPKNPRNKLR